MRLVLLGTVAVLCALQGGRAEESSPPSLYSVVKDDLLEKGLYRKPGRLVSKVAHSGAVSVNAEWEGGRRRTFFIEQQRYGADLIQAGLVRKDEALVRQGWKLLKWGFDRQGTDGSFPGTGDPFHSTSFFVEAAARALLLHKQSGWPGAEDLTNRYGPTVAAAARWLMRPDVARRGRKNNAPYTHRRWLLAASLGQTAVLVGDRQMAQAAADYAREGLGLQTEEGVNPEKGGADVSYQAVGVLFAERYYTVCPDAALRAAIKKMIVQALRWELGRIDERGRVSPVGSSRVGREVGRTGTVKKVDYKSLVQALVVATALTGDGAYKEVAARVAVAVKWVQP
jgi:hypothetical protein